MRVDLSLPALAPLLAPLLPYVRFAALSPTDLLHTQLGGTADEAALSVLLQHASLAVDGCNEVPVVARTHPDSGSNRDETKQGGCVHQRANAQSGEDGGLFDGPLFTKRGSATAARSTLPARTVAHYASHAHGIIGTVSAPVALRALPPELAVAVDWRCPVPLTAAAAAALLYGHPALPPPPPGLWRARRGGGLIADADADADNGDSVAAPLHGLDGWLLEARARAGLQAPCPLSGGSLRPARAVWAQAWSQYIAAYPQLADTLAMMLTAARSNPSSAVPRPLPLSPAGCSPRIAAVLPLPVRGGVGVPVWGWDAARCTGAVTVNVGGAGARFVRVDRRRGDEFNITHSVLPLGVLDWTPYLTLVDSPVAADVIAALGPRAVFEPVFSRGIVPPRAVDTARGSSAVYFAAEMGQLEWTKRVVVSLGRDRVLLQPPLQLAFAPLPHAVGARVLRGVQAWELLARNKWGRVAVDRWGARVGLANATWPPLRPLHTTVGGTLLDDTNEPVVTRAWVSHGFITLPLVTAETRHGDRALSHTVELANADMPDAPRPSRPRPGDGNNANNNDDTNNNNNNNVNDDGDDGHAGDGVNNNPDVITSLGAQWRLYDQAQQRVRERARVRDGLRQHGAWSRTHTVPVWAAAHQTHVLITPGGAEPVTRDLTAESDLRAMQRPSAAATGTGSSRADAHAPEQVPTAAALAVDAAANAAASASVLASGNEARICSLQQRLRELCDAASNTRPDILLATRDGDTWYARASAIIGTVSELERLGCPPRTIGGVGLPCSELSSVQVCFDEPRGLLHLSTSVLLRPAYSPALLALVATRYRLIAAYTDKLEQLCDSLFSHEAVAADALPAREWEEVVRRGKLLQARTLFALISSSLSADMQHQMLVGLRARSVTLREQMNEVLAVMRFIYARFWRSTRVTTIPVPQRALELKALDAALGRLADRAKAGVWFRALEDAWLHSLALGTPWTAHPVWAIVPAPVRRAVLGLAEQYKERGGAPRDVFTPFVGATFHNDVMRSDSVIVTLKAIPLTAFIGWESVGLSNLT